jgi:hypothetical protein
MNKPLSSEAKKHIGRTLDEAQTLVTIDALCRLHQLTAAPNCSILIIRFMFAWCDFGVRRECHCY